MNNRQQVRAKCGEV